MKTIVLKGVSRKNHTYYISSSNNKRVSKVIVNDSYRIAGYNFRIEDNQVRFGCQKIPIGYLPEIYRSLTQYFIHLGNRVVLRKHSNHILTTYGQTQNSTTKSGKSAIIINGRKYLVSSVTIEDKYVIFQKDSVIFTYSPNTKKVYISENLISTGLSLTEFKRKVSQLKKIIP